MSSFIPRLAVVAAVLSLVGEMSAGQVFQPAPAPFSRPGKTVCEGKCLPDKIVFGSGAILLDPDGQLQLKTERCHIPLSAWFGIVARGETLWVELSRKDRNCKELSLEYDGGKTYRLAGKILLNDMGPMADASLEISLLDDNQLKFVLACGPMSGARIEPAFFATFSGQIINMEGGKFQVESKKGKEEFSLGVKPAEIAGKNKNDKGEDVYFSYYDRGFINAEFSITGKYPVFGLKSEDDHILSVRGYGERDLERLSIVQVSVQKPCLTFTMDISGNEVSTSLKPGVAAYKNINFASDNLVTPNYNLSRNLIQNPSLNAGWRYYSYKAHYPYRQGEIVPPQENPWTIDETGGINGSRCLRLKAYPVDGEAMPFKSYVQSFVVPASAGKKHTVSFFARTDAVSARISLFALTCGQPGAKYVGYYYPKADMVVDKAWRRFSFEFVPDGQVADIIFSAASAQNGGCVYFDDLQLEEGAMTDFAASPLDAELLVNGKPEMVFGETEKTDDIRLNAFFKDLPALGRMKVSIENFYGMDLFAEEYPIVVGKDGRMSVVIDPAGALDNNGLYSIRVDFECGALKKTEFFRFARMPYLENKHQHKNLFGTHSMPVEINRKSLEMFRKFGIGAFVKLRPEKDLFDLLSDYGVAVLSTELARRHREGKRGTGFYACQENAIFLKERCLAHWPLDIKEVSAALEKEIEVASWEVAKAYPWLKYWSFFCELHGYYPKLPPQELVKILKAVHRGVKRATPDAKVYQEGGAANMSANLGIKVTDEYLSAVKGEVKFDVIGIHPYRQLPESPDLDDDTAALLEMLEGHGYRDIPVIWEEGNYFPFYLLPDLKLNAHNGAASSDHWNYHKAFSYDIGWGEKIAAAYTARYNLVALKYSDRVKGSVMWTNGHFLDAYYTPFAWLKTCNTLGNLLGDAKYLCTLSFAPKTRVYMFEDAKQRPVAALWSYSRAVDNGEKNASEALVKFEGVEPEIFGLMGEKLKLRKDRNGESVIPVTPFPLFIRGEKGSTEALKTALGGALMSGLDGSLRLDASLSSVTDAAVLASNAISRPWQGEITLNGRSQELELGGCMKKALAVPLSSPVSLRGIDNQKIIALVQRRGGGSFSTNLSFPAFAVKKLERPIVVDGALEDWAGVPAIPLSSRIVNKKAMKEELGYNGDFEASFKVAWSDEFFYLAVIVDDDKFVASDDLPLAERYKMDSVQVYVDCMGENRVSGNDGFHATDYNYDFFPSRNGGALTAYRRFAPSQQYCGGAHSDTVEPNIKTAFKVTERGYVYEIAFPKRYLQPVRLAPGSCPGFGITVNDTDKDSVNKASLGVIPGKGCFGNLSQLPLMLFTE